MIHQKLVSRDFRKEGHLKDQYHKRLFSACFNVTKVATIRQFELLPRLWVDCSPDRIQRRRDLPDI